MDGNAPRRRPAGPWVVALVLVGLLAAVGIASTGDVPGGGGAARRPSEQLLDVTMSLLAVLVLVGGVVAVVALAFFRRDDAAAAAVGGRRRRTPGQALASLLLGLVLVIVALRLVRSDDGPAGGDGLLPGLDGLPGIAEEQQGRYEPQFTPWPVAIAVALLVAAVAAVLLRRRAHRASLRAQADAGPEAVLADVLDETLDDLREEADPRRAVIGAYARMERALGAVGLPRREAEAPEEYLARVLRSLELPRRDAARLTDLFAWARFSGHDVQPAMKDEAIDTLCHVRDELRATVERREAEAAARALQGVPA